MSDIKQLLNEYAQLQQTIKAQDAAFADVLKQVRDFQLQRLRETHPYIFADKNHKTAAEFILLSHYTDPNFREAMDEMCDKVSAISIIPQKIIAGLIQGIAAVTATDAADIAVATGFIKEGFTQVNLENYIAVLRKHSAHEVRIDQFTKVGDLGKLMDETMRGRMLKSAFKITKKPMEVAGLGATHQFLSQSLDIVNSIKSAENITRPFGEKEIAFSAKLYSGDDNPYAI